MNRLTMPALASAVPDVSAHGEPFNDILEQLRKSSETQIFVNWRVLERIHVRQDLPVTVEWKHLTMAEALTTLLDEVGSHRAQIGHTIDEGVIVISTADDLAKNVNTRVDDIRAGIRDDHRREDVASIIRNVEGIQPLTWKDNGGTCGACRELSGQLIVTQTPAIQRRFVESSRRSLHRVPRHPHRLTAPRLAAVRSQRSAQP